MNSCHSEPAYRQAGVVKRSEESHALTRERSFVVPPQDDIYGFPQQ